MIYIYIYSYPQTDCLVVLQLFSVVGPLSPEPSSFSAFEKEFFMHIFLHIRYQLPRVLNL